MASNLFVHVPGFLQAPFEENTIITSTLELEGKKYMFPLFAVSVSLNPSPVQAKPSLEENIIMENPTLHIVLFSFLFSMGSSCF